MLNAIAGSMMLAGGETMLSAASESVMLWPIVNAVTMRTSASQRAAEQQQADEEQDVIGPDEDVMRPRRDERLHHRNRALRRPEVVGARIRRGVEDHLLTEIRVLVDVDEGLMDRVVGKEVRVDRERARMLVGDAVRQPQGRAPPSSARSLPH